MLVRSRFPEDGDHTGGDFSPSVSRVTNRDSSRGPLVIATAYVSKLTSNAAVNRYLSQNHPELLAELSAIVAATSLDQVNA